MQDKLPISVLGVYKVNNGSEVNDVMFLEYAEANLVLPILIGEPEALSIQMALEGVKGQRPITHDLVMSMLERVQYEVEKVTIDGLISTVYTATIHLRNMVEGRVVTVDARPSDSVAIALRAGCQIYVDKSLKSQMVSKDSLKLPETRPRRGDEGDDEEIDSPYGA